MSETATAMAQDATCSKLTEAQKRYITLERHYAHSIKPILDELNIQKQRVIDESNIRQTGQPVFFQDVHGTVHCVTEREYISVKTSPWCIDHTRRPELGETKGSLSEKAAHEAGFTPVINK